MSEYEESLKEFFRTTSLQDLREIVAELNSRENRSKSPWERNMAYINTPLDLGRFFATEEKPVSINEFYTFWNSLTDDEKTYYRNAPLH